MELRDYWHVIWKRKYITALCVVVLFLGALFVNYNVLEVTYQATAKMLVEQPPRVLMLTDKTANLPPPLSLETQVRLIKSLRVAEGAAKRLRYDDPERAALRLHDRIVVDNIKDTGIINITSEGPDPKECADIANAFAEAFEEISYKIARESIEEATKFIEDQLKIAATELEDAEIKIYEFNKEHGIISLEDEVRERNSMIVEFEIQKMSQEVALNGLMAQIGNLENIFNDKLYAVYQDPDAITQTGLFSSLKKDILDLEVERAALKLRLKDDHPRVKELDKRVQQLQSRLEKSISNLVAKRLIFEDEIIGDRDRIVGLQTERLIADASIETLGQVIERLSEQQRSYPELKYEYSRLTRTRDVAEKLYLLLYEKRQQARIDEVQRDVKVKVFQKATVPAAPVKPQRLKNIFIVVVFALFLGIGVSFVLEEMEETIHNSDDVKNYLNLPVLGSIPYSAETINKLITEVPLKSPIAESYRRLSFFTQLFCLDPPIKTLLITSSKSDEGKSTTLANLAISMAQEGTKVLIVDTDLRRPMLHRMFNIDNSLGVSSVLTGELEAELAVSDLSVSGHLPKESFMELIVDRLIQPLGVRGLSIIPSGPLPANSIELIRSERMLAFLRTIEKKADIIMFDSPPAIHVVDAVVLSQILDGVLLVINAGRINKDEALQVKYMIESTKTPILGVALNNIAATSPDYYYYYYYGGYGYGTRQRRKRIKLKR
ncbi:MAG: P-loop NTPase [bacterium]